MRRLTLMLVPPPDMPQILRDQISVHIIQSRDHILNTYSETISKYAEVREGACNRGRLES